LKIEKTEKQLKIERGHFDCSDWPYLDVIRNLSPACSGGAGFD